MDWRQREARGRRAVFWKLHFCPCSLFSSRLLFRRRARIEPHLDKIKLKAKRSRRQEKSLEDKEGESSLRNAKQRLPTWLKGGGFGLFNPPSRSSHSGDFKENLAINKRAFGLLDLFEGRVEAVRRPA